MNAFATLTAIEELLKDLTLNAETDHVIKLKRTRRNSLTMKTGRQECQAPWPADTEDLPSRSLVRHGA